MFTAEELKKHDWLSRQVQIKNVSFETKYPERLNPETGQREVKPEDWVTFSPLSSSYDDTTSCPVRRYMPSEKNPMGSPEWETIGPLYDAWKEDRDAPVNGTPLTTWNALSPNEVQRLKSLDIKSVEQLSKLSDAMMARTKIHNIRGIVTEAKKFLTSTVTPREYKAELKARDDLLEEQNERMAAMQAQIDQLLKAQAPKETDLEDDIA